MLTIYCMCSMGLCVQWVRFRLKPITMVGGPCKYVSLLRLRAPDIHSDSRIAKKDFTR